MARVNRAIELLEQGQPVYYSSPRELSYEGGVEASQTWSDYLVVEMEHGTFNLAGLDAFMKGLAASGPHEKRTSHADDHHHAADRRHRRTCHACECVDG